MLANNRARKTVQCSQQYLEKALFRTLHCIAHAPLYLWCKRKALYLQELLNSDLLTSCVTGHIPWAASWNTQNVQRLRGWFTQKLSSSRRQANWRTRIWRRNGMLLSTGVFVFYSRFYRKRFRQRNPSSWCWRFSSSSVFPLRWYMLAVVKPSLEALMWNSWGLSNAFFGLPVKKIFQALHNIIHLVISDRDSNAKAGSIFLVTDYFGNRRDVKKFSRIKNLSCVPILIEITGNSSMARN